MVCPLVSVNIANYNNGHFISECVQSVLNQSYKNIEIVIVDDCSTDDSTTKIHACGDPRIRCYENKENAGIAKVRNQALLLSSGEYVTSLDSDDVYISEEKIKEEMNVLRCFKVNTGKDVIAFSDIMLLDTYGENISLVSSRDRIKEGYVFQEMLRREVFIPRDYLCKKEQILEVGSYNDSLSIYEDWDLKLRLAKRYEFHFSNVTGIGYRRHGNGLSSAPAEEHEYWKAQIRSQYA